MIFLREQHFAMAEKEFLQKTLKPILVVMVYDLNLVNLNMSHKDGFYQVYDDDCYWNYVVRLHDYGYLYED